MFFWKATLSYYRENLLSSLFGTEEQKSSFSGMDMVRTASQFFASLFAAGSRVKSFFLPQTVQQFVASLLVLVTTLTTMPLSADEFAQIIHRTDRVNTGIVLNNAEAPVEKRLKSGDTTLDAKRQHATPEVRLAGVRQSTLNRDWPAPGARHMQAVGGPQSAGLLASTRSALRGLTPTMITTASGLTTSPGTSSSIASNFNSTPTPAGDYIWFNSVLSPKGIGSAPVRIFLRSASIQFTASGKSYNLAVPNATITFSSKATSATTTYNATNNEWQTTVPVPLSGNAFLTGLAFPVPTGGLPGGINPVTFKGQFYTDTSGVSLNWQWAAAVYTKFTTAYNGLGVKPIDSSTGSQYKNSDHAGTPESYKTAVTCGARGGGGSNYTGSYSSTACVNPVVGIPDYPPIANAGPNQTVTVQSTVHLDGTKSTDYNGNPLIYAWSFASVPSGSTAALSGATTAQPTFIADRVGTYTVQLIVNDGFLTSAPSTVIISTNDVPPVANAGPNQTVKTRALVQLDGSGSTDVDGKPLTFAWSFTSKPANSTAVLSNPNIVNPTFTTNEKGTYVVQLVVNDGYLSSNPSSVTISDINSPPVANPGPDQTIQVGNIVKLDGSGSTDVDGDTLTYRWAILSAPTGSTATLSSATVVNPTFVPDMLGTYIVQLIVNDGTVDSQPKNVTISTDDVPPVANPGNPQTVSVGSVVSLDGSASTDSDNHPLTYTWAILNKPATSQAALSSSTSAQTSFTADVGGDYLIQLIVNDGFLSSPPRSEERRVG